MTIWEHRGEKGPLGKPGVIYFFGIANSFDYKFDVCLYFLDLFIKYVDSNYLISTVFTMRWLSSCNRVHVRTYCHMLLRSKYSKTKLTYLDIKLSHILEAP